MEFGSSFQKAMALGRKDLLKFFVDPCRRCRLNGLKRSKVPGGGLKRELSYCGN